MGHQGFVGREVIGAGGARECYLSVDVEPDLAFLDQLEALRVGYLAAKAEMGLQPGSAIFRRVFLSDAMNQAERVRVSELMSAPDEGPVAVSIVQQPPAHGAKLSLLAYHVERDAPAVKRTLGHHHTLVEMGGRRHLWSTRMCAAADVGPASAADQTREVFRDLIGALAAQGGTLRDDCVRTWLYIRDVDVFYTDMVKSRAEIFKREGLTGDTHFIASTGIEGACAHHYDLVAMDAYSVLGLAPGQMSYLNDFDHLCATKDYGVTFERATRLAYGDRAHIFMSGTASIDGEGWVVHPGDVLRQLDRALENVDALLVAGEMQLADLTHLIVYLRDRGDYCRVRNRLGERFPSLPLQIVQGPVCRPEWLIEVEGIAAKTIQKPGVPAF
ncbi:MAG: Rid family hydrolase [Roseiarcus sp.]|jgi:enamine deaminase RidA (YjgF/YER057c/UK114 family)|uniref:Rid family hydrolase n=1 Tax=Roseiarcus sp. TaxID=1969460 RepID=UPI003C19D6FC